MTVLGFLRTQSCRKQVVKSIFEVKSACGSTITRRLSSAQSFFHKNSFLPRAYTRETREGWPLLTVETEVNGDLKSTNERGPSLVGSLGLSCWCSYNRFFPHRTLLQFLFPHPPASWAGSRAGSPVSVCVYGLHQKTKVCCNHRE
jgi:hypothetical protein